MAAGAVGAFGTPGLMGAAEVRLGCLLELLGRRRMEPVRERVTGSGCTGTWLLVAFRVISERSTMLCAASALLPRMVPWPVGDGNWVSLKSVEADSKLLCRSSKLTEGRNSNEVAVSVTSSDRPLRPPKENREWLLEDEALSIGASRVGRLWWMDPILVGLEVRDLLNGKTRATVSEPAATEALRNAGKGKHRGIGETTLGATGFPVWGQRGRGARGS